MKSNKNLNSNLIEFIFKDYWISAGTTLLCLASCNGPEIPEKKSLPNIILIVSDDQGYNDLGAYGGNDIVTPNIDRLAGEGIRFTNFYVTCSVSTPSRCSMLTGRYPQRNGTTELFRANRVDDHHQYDSIEYSTSWERIGGTDLQEILFPELLQEAGYRNGIFGKWDMGQLKRFLPLQRGFNEFYGFPNTGIDYYTHERYGIPSMFRNNDPTTEDKGTYCTYLFEREALRFIKENKENPFFLYLPFNAPHAASSWEPMDPDELFAPAEYLEKYAEGKNINEKKRRGYKAAVSCMDNAIGNVLNLIDSLELQDNTFVIFFSDNGGGTGSDNSPLSGGKGTMLEGGLRVPCIMRWTGKIEKGKVLDNFISTLEIFPTILSAAGISKPRELILDGFDIIPLLTGKKDLHRDEMYWELRGEYAMRSGNLKWIQSKKENGLFDLSDDLAEKKDLSEINRVDNNRLKEKFLSWKNDMKNAEPRGPYKDF